MSRLAIVENGKLRRTTAGVFRVPSFDLTEADALMLEAFLIENELMDDPIAALRALILGSIKDPRWALATVDRRKNLAAFRKAFFSKLISKLEEIRLEVADELIVLAAETDMEVAIDADQA